MGREVAQNTLNQAMLGALLGELFYAREHKS